MDFKEIQELIKMFSKSGIGEIKIEQENFSIKLKSNESFMTNVVTSSMSTPMMMPSQMTQAVAPTTQTNSSPEPKPESSAPASVAGKSFKAPMIGTFYRSSGPDKEPFIKVGDRIEIGQPVCIIEAMKLFNEIESDVAGVVTKILVDDKSPVEYDQPLFIVE
ncbi:MAG: acetyl-CoA carboxylase biotin carboxyl carrier protein [Chitinophagales bacterium]